MRIAVNAREKDIRALVEDRLRAVAVVIVDVQDGHTIEAAVAQSLCRDRRVVQEAVAAEEVGARMMAGRARQGEGAARPAQHMPRRRQCTGGAATRRRPGPRGQRTARVEREKPHARRETRREHIRAESADRPVRGNGIALRVGGIQRDPFVPGAAQEIHVALRMNPGDGFLGNFGRRLDRSELARLQFAQHVVGTGRHFETRHELATEHLALALVQRVAVVEEREHPIILPARVPARHRCACHPSPPVRAARTRPPCRRRCRLRGPGRSPSRLRRSRRGRVR